MTIEEKIKELIIERYGNMVSFANRIGMPAATLSTIMKRGIQNASIQSIIKICKELGISADALSENKIVLLKDITKDVSEIMQFMKMSLTAKDLALDGEPLTDAEKQIVMDALELCLEFIRRQR